MTDSEWLRDFDERNKDVTEDDVKRASMWFTLAITADERLLLTSGLTRQAAAAPQTADGCHALVNRLLEGRPSETSDELREARMMDEHHRLQYEQAQAEADRLAEALERLVRPPALNLRDPANSGDLEVARHVLKRRQEKL